MSSARRYEGSGQECPLDTTYFVRLAVQFVTKTSGVETLSVMEQITKFAHLTQPKVQFSKMPRRTATSIVLVTVLLAGNAPTSVCVLMCERQAQAKAQRHCSDPPESMPGMVHDHSAMNHSGVETISAVLVSQLCETNCVTAERLNVWKEVVPQVTEVRSRAVVLSTTAEFLALDFTAAWGFDSGPPTPSPPHLASFSILRI